MNQFGALLVFSKLMERKLGLSVFVPVLKKEDHILPFIPLVMKKAIKVAGSIFVLVAFGHLLRLLTGIPVTIGSWRVPMYVSVLGFMLATGFSWCFFQASKCKGPN